MKRLTALTASAVLVLATLTACGSSDDNLTPSARGPQNVSGQSTCVWIDSPAECQDSGVPPERWFQSPQTQPAASNAGFHDDDFLMQLFMWHVIYSDWFSSPGYYDRYVPVARRTVYVTHVTTFNATYHVQEQSARSRATYRTSSGKTVTGNKVDPKKFAPPKNNGGDRTKTCNLFGLELLSPPKPPVPRPARPAVPAPKKNTGVGGDRNKGGANQHGC